MLSQFLEYSCMMPYGSNLFYMTCSRYKYLKKDFQAYCAQVLIGILRLMSYFLMYLRLTELGEEWLQSIVENIEAKLEDEFSQKQGRTEI